MLDRVDALLQYLDNVPVFGEEKQEPELVVLKDVEKKNHCMAPKNENKKELKKTKKRKIMKKKRYPKSIDTSIIDLSLKIDHNPATPIVAGQPVNTTTHITGQPVISRTFDKTLTIPLENEESPQSVAEQKRLETMYDVNTPNGKNIVKKLKEFENEYGIIFLWVTTISSHLYGTANIYSDNDIYGYFIYPKETYFSPETPELFLKIECEDINAEFFLREFRSACLKITANEPTSYETLGSPIVYACHPLFYDFPEFIVNSYHNDSLALNYFGWAKAQLRDLCSSLKGNPNVYERKKACYIIRIFCTSYLIHQRKETKGPIFNIAELLQHMAEHFSDFLPEKEFHMCLNHVEQLRKGDRKMKQKELQKFVIWAEKKQKFLAKTISKKEEKCWHKRVVYINEFCQQTISNCGILRSTQDVNLETLFSPRMEAEQPTGLIQNLFSPRGEGGDVPSTFDAIFSPRPPPSSMEGPESLFSPRVTSVAATMQGPEGIFSPRVTNTVPVHTQSRKFSFKV